MIRRIYVCMDEECSYTYEVYQTLSEGIDKICPKCKKETLFQDLTGIYGGVSEPRTLGSLAERNTKLLGAEKIASIERKREEEFAAKREKERREMEKIVPGIKFRENKKEEPWFGKLPKNVEKEIFSKKGEDQAKRIEKYIHEGK